MIVHERRHRQRGDVPPEVPRVPPPGARTLAGPASERLINGRKPGITPMSDGGSAAQAVESMVASAASHAVQLIGHLSAPGGAVTWMGPPLQLPISNAELLALKAAGNSTANLNGATSAAPGSLASHGMLVSRRDGPVGDAPVYHVIVPRRASEAATVVQTMPPGPSRLSHQPQQASESTNAAVDVLVRGLLACGGGGLQRGGSGSTGTPGAIDAVGVAVPPMNGTATPPASVVTGTAPLQPAPQSLNGTFEKTACTAACGGTTLSGCHCSSMM